MEIADYKGKMVGRQAERPSHEAELLGSCRHGSVCPSVMLSCHRSDWAAADFVEVLLGDLIECFFQIPSS